MTSAGLAAPCGGHLKRDVSVALTDERIHITYALWKVTLPRAWARANPVIGQLLDKRLPRDEALRDPVAAPLAALLDAQGCFAPAIKPRYTLREVKALFDPMRSQWYADYYAHPAWRRLRGGEASLNGVLAWLIHNYHISRAAGIVAARMAALGRDDGMADFFRQDALDEYWHCDAYYSLDTPLLKDVTLARIKACLPLPATLAFEDHTLRVAERAPLGHLLIAYFQESSIAFAQDSHDFYRLIESRYQLHGLFGPWKQHMQIDVDEGHADGLGRLLESDRVVDAGVVEQALEAAWLAFYFLRGALDQVLEHDQGDRSVLRAPPAAPEHVASMQDLLETYLDHAAAPGMPPDGERVHLMRGLRDSAFRVLGFARRHDEIIACGRWAHKLSRTPPASDRLPDRTPTPSPPASDRLPEPTPMLSPSATDRLPAPGPWTRAVVNRMHEAANRPATWLLLASLLSSRMPECRLGGEWQARLERLLRDTDVAPDAPAALAQLDALIACCAASRDTMPASLLAA